MGISKNISGYFDKIVAGQKLIKTHENLEKNS